MLIKIILPNAFEIQSTLQVLVSNERDEIHEHIQEFHMTSKTNLNEYQHAMQNLGSIDTRLLIRNHYGRLTDRPSLPLVYLSKNRDPFTQVRGRSHERSWWIYARIYFISRQMHFIKSTLSNT